MTIFPSEFDYDSLTPGAVVFHHYRILRCLGKGSTSTVYACNLDNEYSLVAALKIISKMAAADKALLSRFRNEYRASQRIHHAHVVEYIDLLKHGSYEAYLIELVEGGSLHNLLFGKGMLALPEVIRILSQLCLGLQAIHEAGIVHRDIKPKNILLTLEHNVKISDFSTALFLDDNSGKQDIGLVGTYDYMSPEVLETGVASPRSDIFALGVIAYQLICAKLPFMNDSFNTAEVPKRKTSPPLLHLVRNDCPHSLSKLISQALAIKPAKRIPRAITFYEELQALSLEPRKEQGWFSRFKR